MLLTFTVLHSLKGTSTAPWVPESAQWWQTGHSSAGSAQPPETDGTWWSVLAGWDDPGAAGAPPQVPDVEVWHVVLEPVSAQGDVVLGDGTRPFVGLTGTSAPEAPAVLITVAGESADEGREREFFRRFLHVSREIGSAAGHLVSLVQAPAAGSGAGPVLTFSAWTDLEAGLRWAYERSRPHPSAVTRQRSHALVRASGSVRCAVLASSGSLGGVADPLAFLGEHLP